MRFHLWYLKRPAAVKKRTVHVPTVTMSGTTSSPCVWKAHQWAPTRPKPTCTSSAIQTPPAARTALGRGGGDGSAAWRTDTVCCRRRRAVRLGLDEVLWVCRDYAESWDEGDGRKWARMDVNRATGSGCVTCQPRRYAGRGSQATVGHLSRGAARGPPHTRWPTAIRPGLTRVGQRNKDR